MFILQIGKGCVGSRGVQYVAVVGVQLCEVVLDKFRSEMSESVWFEQQLFDLTVEGF